MLEKPTRKNSECEGFQARIDEALAGEERALTALVERLTPVVQMQVGRCLLRQRPPGRSRDVRQEVEDLTQETFLMLFADDGKVLRSWDPQQGLSLPGFVGLVAQRRATSILRTGKRSPWKEDPSLDQALDGPSSASGPEEVTTSRDLLLKALRRLREELTPLGWRLFDLLFLKELSVADTGRTAGLSHDAVYAWRSRLRRLAGRIFGELKAERGEGKRALLAGDGPHG
jgi:RNA polymerase sigma-70 factor (ECF subfamily)